MPTLNNSGEVTALFFFNHVVAWFGVPQAIVTVHGSHFRNHMMIEFTAKDFHMIVLLLIICKRMDKLRPSTKS